MNRFYGPSILPYLLLIPLLLGWEVLLPRAQAATLQVPSQYATITAAHSASKAGDVILVAPGVYTEPTLNLSRGVTLRGSGTGVTILDGQGIRQVLRISDQASVIEDLTIQNGYLSDGGYGGCVALNSMGATFRRVRITGCVNTANVGGAIGAILGGYTLKLEDVTLDHSSAVSGGGLGQTGGGIVTLTGCDVTDNTATQDGGGLRLAEASTTLTDVVVARNTAGFSGGGIAQVETFSKLGTLTTYGTWIHSNKVTNGTGGGVKFYGYSTGYLRHTVIAGNSASSSGGGIHSVGKVTLENSVVVGNSKGGILIESFTNSYLTGRNNVVAWSTYGCNVNAPSANISWTYNDTYVPSGCNVSGFTYVSSNLSVDPQFLNFSDDGNFTNDHFNLSASSPLINKGTNLSGYDPDGTQTDIGLYGGGSSADLDFDRDGVTFEGDGLTPGDCDDWDIEIPGDEVPDGIDNDCDGRLDESGPTEDDDLDGTSETEGDCDDTNPNVHPGAAEVCDGIDQDCDGQTDEGVLKTYYPDQDGDGYGVPSPSLQACALPTGYSTLSTDCNDQNSSIYPGKAEVCDGVDQDCDGAIDDGVLNLYFGDSDGDGYGWASSGVYACSLPEGCVTNSKDCNDLNASIYPGATEVCDGVDQDCDNVTDEGVKTTFYRDADGDGYGNSSSTTQACQVPSGYTTDAGDCNDSNATAHPGATEVCDGVDQDCNGLVDEGTLEVFYRDADGDGYGTPATTTLTCTAPSGFVQNDQDCNDTSPSIYPGAPEVCDAVDQNCDGSADEELLIAVYLDQDQDGYGTARVSTQACAPPPGYVTDATDCVDEDATIHPGAPEYCDALDSDCDGDVNDSSTTTFYRDADGDGYGNSALTVTGCIPPEGYVALASDCNDASATTYPGALEMCDGIDQDCDGTTSDETDRPYYLDADGDGFGNSAVTTISCDMPQGYSVQSGDCNDGNPAIYPGALETCNQTDDNCNGQLDDGPTQRWYLDQDGDGFGNPVQSVASCSTPQGYVAIDDAHPADCDDSNPFISPSAEEACNRLDDNCDGQVDEGLANTFYQDNDGDGFGNPDTAQASCTLPEGYIAQGGDCDDTRATTYPGAPELCDDLDQDCDGEVDDGLFHTLYYPDTDDDGAGDVNAAPIDACVAPEGHVANNFDCADSDPDKHPGATEVCNSFDDDCNGLVDEDLGSPYYPDDDKDGYGRDNDSLIACDAPEGFSPLNTDCNDDAPDIHPDAPEQCNNVDDNCNDLTDEDLPVQHSYPDVDQDSYGDDNSPGVDACATPEGFVTDASDCNDAQPDIYPGADEINDAQDNDCDGQVDEGFGTETPSPDGDDDGSTGCSCSSGEKAPSTRGYLAWILVGISVGFVRTRAGRRSRAAP